MPLEDLIFREFGVVTDIHVNRLANQVGTSVVKVLDNNPNRLAWTLINLGTGFLMVSNTPEVSATRGIYLASGGGGVNFLWKEEFSAVGWEFYAVAQNAATPIWLLEVVERKAPPGIGGP